LSKEHFRQLKDNKFCFAPRQINDVANVDEVKKDNVNVKKVGEAAPPPKRKVTKDDVDVRKVGEAAPPQKRIGDKVEPLTESLVVTAVPKSTYNNLNPDHAKKDPAVTDKVVLEKEALDGGVITKDDMTMKTVIEADPPSIEVGDKVEPLTESLVVIADP
jgi:hypothetical protein